MTTQTATPAKFDRTRGVDYPVRVEVPMPRGLFDRLTQHDGAPTCRFEEATGLAEFVAMPTLSHESRAALIARLFAHIEFVLVEAGHDPGFLHSLAVRVLSDDGAFEPDASLFVNRSRAVLAAEVEGYLDTRLGHPVPDLVVEVDRSASSRRKLLPYFRMGVREAWTWSPRDGARIWLADAIASGGTMVEASETSAVLAGIDVEALDRLLGEGTRAERLTLSRQMARRVAHDWSTKPAAGEHPTPQALGSARARWRGGATPMAAAHRPEDGTPNTTTPTATASEFDYTQGADYPVRVEIPMPRDLFDSLTDHDDAPVCRYDEASGRAEFVAMPGLSHEGRAQLVARLFGHIEAALVDQGPWPGFLFSGSLRLLSDDGAFEPDASLYTNASHAIAAREVEGYLDTRQAYPAPDLVMEVDRSVRSGRKLLPYFRMGVREAWIWSRPDGASIWLPDPASHDGVVRAEESSVLPGVGTTDLDQLLADGSPEERFVLSRAVARRVAECWMT